MCIRDSPDSMKFEIFIPGVDRKAYFLEPSRERDTLKVWLTDSSLYSQPLIKTIVRYPFTDTLGILRYKQDTVPMRFMPPRAPRVAKIKRTVFTFESNILSGFLKPGQPIVFKSKTPFREPDTSRIHIYEMVLTEKQKVPYELVKDSLNSGKYYMKTKLAEGKKYLFIANAGSFSDIFNLSTDSVGVKFSIKEPDT